MFPFENLEVYKKAFLINRKVYAFLKGNSTMPVYLKSQFGRASLSIVLNIAEGSGRFTPKDRRNFLVMARGSVFECASITEVVAAEQEMSTNESKEIIEGFDEISRMLYSMIKKLED